MNSIDFCLVKKNDPGCDDDKPKRDRFGNLSLGQRKLCLGLIQFLTICIKSSVNNETYLLYAGSAPGKSFVLLQSLFPTIKFILYDTAQHCDELLQFVSSKFNQDKQR